MIGPVGTWSGVSAGEVVREVTKVGEVVGVVAEVVGEVAEVVGEIAEVVGELTEVVGEITEVVGEVAEVVGEVPDAGVVTSSSPLGKESSSTLPIQRMERGRPH